MNLCLLQVHAHPDDEASKGAGTTARYSAEGVRTVLVTCTGGEAGDILNPAMDLPEVRAALHDVRLKELHEATDILGYSSVHLLGYRDSGMPETEPNAHPDAFANADLDEATERLIAIVRAEQPHVIVAYGDDHSGYPHPDHIRAHEIAVRAFDRTCGEPWGPKKLYYVGWVKRRIVAIHEAILKLGKESPYAERLDTWKDDSDHEFTTRIDIRGYMTQRTKALLAHATQIAPDSFWFALPDEMLVDVYPWEDYRLAKTLVEPVRDEGGIETDLFSGIREHAA
jgi:mycothiol S-conjugate amidase